MSENHSVAEVFDALILQTRQRGGSPSVREISSAALAVANLVSACSEVSACAKGVDVPSALAKAIDRMTAAMSKV